MNTFLNSLLRWSVVLLAMLLAPVLAQAQNNAAFVSQVVPASMNAGQPYSVSVTVKNTGATTWTTAAGYTLASQNPTDNTTWGANRVALASAVAPGQQYTFAATVIAPAYGTYNFQWQMGQEGVQYFGPLTPNVVVNVGTGNNAAFVSQSVPASMIAGQGYPVSVTMKNTGVTTWTSAAGIQLGSQNPSDNTTWVASRVALTSAVAPGQQYTFSATVPAPATPGTYNFQWRMGQDPIEWFGTASTNVAVNVAPAPPTITVSRNPVTMVAGRAFTVTWGTTGATTVSRSCTATGTGYAGTTTFAISGTSTGTALVGWVGNPSTCTWTATGSGGSATKVETMTTVAPPAPVVTVSRTPAPMTAGQNYTLTWSSTDATAMTRKCTSTGTGYVDNSTLAVGGTSTALANAAWVGYPSTCTWTATGYGGSGSKVETMTTVAAPVIKITYFHNDISGTPMIATDASGNVLWKETYQPYGSKLNNQVASGNNKLWFAGKPYDGSTGLSYMGARYYDPVLGRFMGVDPKGANPEDIHSFNRYAYGNNNPYKFVDRDGRASTLLIPAAVTVLVAGGIYSAASPAQRQQMIESANRLMRKVDEAVDKFRGLVLNESGGGDAKGGAGSPEVKPSDVAGKTPDQIDQLAKEKGLQPKGPDPQKGKGAYVDPVTGEQRVLVHGDHAHVNDASGNRLDINGNRAPSNSPDAHLPIKATP